MRVSGTYARTGIGQLCKCQARIVGACHVVIFTYFTPKAKRPSVGAPLAHRHIDASVPRARAAANISSPQPHL